MGIGNGTSHGEAPPLFTLLQIEFEVPSVGFCGRKETEKEKNVKIMIYLRV